MKEKLKKIMMALGLYDLKAACKDHVSDTMGPECVPEFEELYDKINRGTPVDMLEAVAVIEIVETVKKQMRGRTIWHRLRNRCATPTE